MTVFKGGSQVYDDTKSAGNTDGHTLPRPKQSWYNFLGSVGSQTIGGTDRRGESPGTIDSASI